MVAGKTEGYEKQMPVSRNHRDKQVEEIVCNFQNCKSAILMLLSDQYIQSLETIICLMLKTSYQIHFTLVFKVDWFKKAYFVSEVMKLRAFIGSERY